MPIPSYGYETDNGKFEAVHPVTKQSMVLSCTADEYAIGYKACKDGALVQDAFPFLDADEREFLISGLTPEQFDEACKVYEDYDGGFDEEEDDYPF